MGRSSSSNEVKFVDESRKTDFQFVLCATKKVTRGDDCLEKVIDPIHRCFKVQRGWTFKSGLSK